MKITRTLQRKFGISAPRLTVRTHIAWYWRWSLFFLLGVLAFVLAEWIYEKGMEYAGFARSETREELQLLKDSVNRLQLENAELRTQSLQNQRQLQIDQATNHDLTSYVKTLQQDNERLKEDLAFFQSLMAIDSKHDAVQIYRFKVEKNDLPGGYRYRVLLLQSGARTRKFQGSLQLWINAVENGKRTSRAVLLDPDRHLDKIPVGFKYYQRLEGIFQIAPSVEIKTVQLRLFEGGVTQPKLTQTVTM